MSDVDQPVKPGKFLGWRMVGIACATQNLAIGSVFGTFGVFLVYVSDAFQATTSATALTISLILLLGGIAGPAIGRYLTRHSIRRLMQTGALLMALGFWGAGLSQSLLVFQLCFGLVAGLGVAMLGTVPSVTLANNWFMVQRGRVMGIVSLPILVMVAPIMLSQLINMVGWRHALNCMALILLAAVVVLQWVVDRPADVGQQPYGGKAGLQSTDSKAMALTNRQLLRDKQFWLLLVGVALTICGSIVLTSHLVKYAASIGMTSDQGALLLSVRGVASLLGAACFGAFADKFGERNVLLFIVAMMSTLWFGLSTSANIWVILTCILMSGLCGAGLFPVFSSLLGRNYGALGMGTALGLSSLLMLPFNMTSGPLAGWLYDINGSYQYAFGLQGLLCGLSVVLLLLVKSGRAHQSTPTST